MIRVVLPLHLQTLAGTDREVVVTPEGTATLRHVLDALEKAHPMLRGTIREHGTLRRRPRVRFYADGRDITFDDVDTPLPDAVIRNDEPLRIIGAISGG